MKSKNIKWMLFVGVLVAVVGGYSVYASMESGKNTESLLASTEKNIEKTEKNINSLYEDKDHDLLVDKETLNDFKLVFKDDLNVDWEKKQVNPIQLDLSKKEVKKNSSKINSIEKKQKKLENEFINLITKIEAQIEVNELFSTNKAEAKSESKKITSANTSLWKNNVNKVVKIGDVDKLVLSNDADQAKVKAIEEKVEASNSPLWKEKMKKVFLVVNNQLNQMKKATVAVQNLFEKENVKADVTRKMYDEAKKEVDQVKQEKTKKQLNEQLAKVLKFVDEKENKQKEEAEKEAEATGGKVVKDEATGEYVVEKNQETEVAQNNTDGGSEVVGNNTSGNNTGGNNAGGGNTGGGNTGGGNTGGGNAGGGNAGGGNAGGGNTGGGNTGGGNTGGGNTGGGNTGGGNTGGGNTGGGNGGGTTTPPPVEELPLGNSGMSFGSQAEANAWADNALISWGLEQGYMGFSTWSIGNGKWTVNFY